MYTGSASLFCTHTLRDCSRRTCVAAGLGGEICHLKLVKLRPNRSILTVVSASLCLVNQLKVSEAGLRSVSITKQKQRHSPSPRSIYIYEIKWIAIVNNIVWFAAIGVCACVCGESFISNDNYKFIQVTSRWGWQFASGSYGLHLPQANAIVYGKARTTCLLHS